MKFFKSRAGATVVLAVAVIASVIFGSHRSLVSERDKVEQQFYNGADDSGYSIAGDLKERQTVAANLATVAGRYLDESAVNDLRAVVDGMEQADGLTQLYDWNLNLEDSAQKVFAMLENAGLTEKDSRYVRGFRTDLAAYADTISRDPYNKAAREFNDEILGRFPASVLGPLTGVRPAEVFEAP